MSDILEKSFNAQARSLRDFGYRDVTPEMVKDAHADWKAGREPIGIISMFCVRAFEEHPDLFGELEQTKKLQTS